MGIYDANYRPDGKPFKPIDVDQFLPENRRKKGKGAEDKCRWDKEVIEKIARYHFRRYTKELLGEEYDSPDNFDTCEQFERQAYLDDAKNELEFLESLGMVFKADNQDLPWNPYGNESNQLEYDKYQFTSNRRAYDQGFSDGSCRGFNDGVNKVIKDGWVKVEKGE